MHTVTTMPSWTCLHFQHNGQSVHPAFIHISLVHETDSGLQICVRVPKSYSAARGSHPSSRLLRPASATPRPPRVGRAADAPAALAPCTSCPVGGSGGMGRPRKQPSHGGTLYTPTSSSSSLPHLLRSLWRTTLRPTRRRGSGLLPTCRGQDPARDLAQFALDLD